MIHCRPKMKVYRISPSYTNPRFTLDLLRKRCLDGEQFEYLYFWGHQPPNDGSTNKSCLSQWFPTLFYIDDIAYPTAEHWMMASKARLFNDEDILGEILIAPDPGQAKALGRKVKNFDDKTWKANARSLVTQGNLAKFQQNPPLRDYLLSTGDTILAEASPYDRIWGIGLKASDPKSHNPATWQGQNLLGFALMDVRERLSESA